MPVYKVGALSMMLYYNKISLSIYSISLVYNSWGVKKCSHSPQYWAASYSLPHSLACTFPLEQLTKLVQFSHKTYLPSACSQQDEIHSGSVESVVDVEITGLVSVAVTAEFTSIVVTAEFTSNVLTAGCTSAVVSTGCTSVVVSTEFTSVVVSTEFASVVVIGEFPVE